MARIALLYHAPGTRVFAVRDGKPVEFEVKGISLKAEHLERGEAEHPVAEVGADERPLSELPLMHYGDLCGSAEEALAHHASLEAKGMLRPRAETQSSTVEWTKSRYPDETGKREVKVMNLIEEVAELAREAGLDPDRAAAHFRASVDRPPSEGDRDAAVGGEIGDVGIALYDAAEAFGTDADRCRDLKMASVRILTPEDCAARQERKRAKGL